MDEALAYLREGGYLRGVEEGRKQDDRRPKGCHRLALFMINNFAQ